MSQKGKIKIRDIKELQASDVARAHNALTPLKKRKNLRSATTTKKNLKEGDRNDEIVTVNNIASTITKTARKSLLKSALKETPSNQKRIDSYFTSCPKTYEIKVPKEETPFVKSKPYKTETKANGSHNTRSKNKSKQSAGRPRARRKRLFTDSTEPSTESMLVTDLTKVDKNDNNVECIILDSDDEEENNIKPDIAAQTCNLNENQIVSTNGHKVRSVNASPITASSLSFGQQLSKTSHEITTSKENSNVSGSSRRKAKPCPPYKIIENTTFAVDAFQFGYIENVSHYFLTHFHADHYIGLTKSFAMPLFVSPITARLLRAFIPVQEQYIHELELNTSVVVNNIEITALDANHCPGSIMIVFKFLDTGKCVLHTGDFRACPDMESEPIFWNNHIHTIYLDTTYISEKYTFCSQYESIEKAHSLIDNFLIKHCWHRVLYVCGSYIIGKEKFWSSLAEDLSMKVWTEGNRIKALKAINDERINGLLVEDPNQANMHILPMGKLGYLALVEYFKLYEHNYDVLFALRPSGWEKDTKPRYGSKINLIGIEYSEHSSYAEMQRFVKFLKPEQVISTVPSGKNLMETSSVPKNWYKYDKLKVSSNYQPSIDSFLRETNQRNLSIRPPNVNKGGVEHFVSPFKLCTPPNNKVVANNSGQALKAFSLTFSPPAEINEHIEEIVRDKSPTNVQIEKKPRKPKILTLAKSISNSSEDFEKADFIIKTKTIQNHKKDLKVKDHKKVVTKTKPKRNKKPSKPKNNSAQDNEINCEELLQTPVIKLESSQLLKSPVLNNLKISSTQQRITRSQSSPSKLTNSLSKTKTNQYAETSKQTSYKKSKTKSISSTATTDKTTPLELKLPISQKRVTKSKTNSYKTSISLRTEMDNEYEFESKLLQITEQPYDQTVPNLPKSQLKSILDLHKYQENAILKSTTDSSVDRLSNNEIDLNKIKPSTTCENFLDDFEKLPPKLSTTKRPALNRNLTPFKKTKSTFNTRTILNTILEQSEEIDRFNCSQLAGLVMETVNQQNPDNNKDHIPADLLSDADDDWM